MIDALHAEIAADHRQSDWLMRWPSSSQPRLRLICLPYAGGAASVYAPWRAHMPGGVELCSVQLPGRERRLREAPIDSMETLITVLTRALEPFLDRPFALFGHSMGSLIAFELAHRLRVEGLPGPLHLFLSAMYAPAQLRQRPQLHELPDSELMDAVRTLSGTPQLVLDNRELMQAMLPALRADFRLIETYRYRQQARLRCPLSLCGGKDDRITRRDLAAWRSEVASSFCLRLFPGDHFYLQSNPEALLRFLVHELELLLVQVNGAPAAKVPAGPVAAPERSSHLQTNPTA